MSLKLESVLKKSGLKMDEVYVTYNPKNPFTNIYIYLLFIILLIIGILLLK